MREVVKTDDGSMTLYSAEYEDHYHSVKGALAESVHIFIHNGLCRMLKDFDTLNILEVGFGTGLNALCTFVEAENHNIKINYFGIEPEPISIDEASQLEYCKLFGDKDLHDVFIKMHMAEHNQPHYLSDNFVLNTICAKIEEVDLQPSAFHLVYFDPFKPDTHAEVWTTEVFNRIFHALKPGGIMLTYSSRGSVRRAMKDAGFNVEKIPGPCGKREISMAVKDCIDKLEYSSVCGCSQND